MVLRASAGYTRSRQRGRTASNVSSGFQSGFNFILEKEERERKAEATARQAEALSQLLSTEGEPSADVSNEFFTSHIGAGGTPTTAVNTLLSLREDRNNERRRNAANAALAELGAQFGTSRDPRQKFAGSILSDPDIDPSTKIGILQQTGALFPESEKAKMRDVKVYNSKGEEDVVRVPGNVSNPQQYIETNMPDLVAAGFSTRKPKLKSEARESEGQRNVQAFVATSPTLQAQLKDGSISPAEARSRARIILKERPRVLQQLEKDLGRETEAGLFAAPDAPKERLIFEMARSNITGVMASGEIDPGKAVKAAKQRAEQQFEELEFLPEDLKLTPERARSMDHIQRVAEFLMDEKVGVVEEGSTPEESFNEVVRLLKNRMPGWSDAHTDELRRRLFPEPEEEEAEPSGGGIMDRLFSR